MANNPPSGTQFAIPNFKNTTNRQVTSEGVEPGTWECIASGQPSSFMDGTYTTTGSHFFTGGSTVYGSYHCFERNGIPLLDSNGTHYYGDCWESRSGSNNYNASGSYTGSTTTTIGGSQIKGEYVSITAPYGIVLKSYTLISSDYNGVSTPASGWVIGGSNDGGATYDLVDTVTNNPLPLNDYRTFNISNTTSYTTYIIVITNITNGIGAANIGTWNLYSPIINTNPPCFKRDTNILCFTNNTEIYVPIQDIRKGTLVKTIKNGYVQVNAIGNSYIYNSGDNERIKERLYKYTSANYPEINEDLIVTGCHAILANHLTDEERAKTIELFSNIYVTDKLYRLFTVINMKSQLYELEGTYEIWHLALDNDDLYMNYGIYANGLLVETTSIYDMNHRLRMKLIE